MLSGKFSAKLHLDRTLDAIFSFRRVNLKIALAQANATVGTIKANADKAIELIKQAKRRHAQVVVFPELYLCGYPPEDLLFFETFIDDCEREVLRVAKVCKGIIAVIGAPVRSSAAHAKHGHPQKLHNSAVVLGDQRVLAVQHKMALPNYGVFDEKRYFLPGRTSYLFEVAGASEMAGPTQAAGVRKPGPFRFGVTICEDIWVENGPQKALAEAGADLIINISSSPYHSGKWHIRHELLKKRTSELGVPVAYVNLVGGQDELVFDGRSMVMNGSGELIALGSAFEEDLIFCEIKAPVVRKKAPRSSSKVEHFAINVQLPKSAPGSKLHSKTHSTLSKAASARFSGSEPEILADDLDALCLGLRDYFLKNKFQTAVIGLSGGIDSALTAAIAVRALGRENVHGVMMPSRYSSKGSITDSKKLAKNLGIKVKLVPIDGLYSDYLKLLKKDFRGLAEDITEQNLQARIRGNILMAYANKFGSLVLATGNKSELAVGYSTLYGDMVGGFALIKDLFKTKVYSLSRNINDQAGYELIPRNILVKAPSAELKPDQFDEDDLPAYDLLDQILRLYIEEDLHFDEICTGGFEPSVVKRILFLVDNAEYKRRQGPVGVKISPRAFGRDRRMPITNGYRP